MRQTELREALKPPPYPLPDPGAEVREPSYAVALAWMRTMKGRRVTYDYWARGNYVRRLLFNQRSGVRPLLVRVSNLKELHWAHRRLALLGSPVEYIYAGGLEKTWVKHMLPLDIELDAGWGYVAFMGTVFRSPQGRRCVAMLGHARLMPEPIFDWIVEEAAEEFGSGQAFIAPAQLIGLHPNATSDDLARHLQLTGGSALTDKEAAAAALLELRIPFIDKLDSKAYRALLKDYGDHLQDFRRLWHDYVTCKGRSEQDALDMLRNIKDAVESLERSDIHIRFRDAIGTLGGVLGFSATIVSALSGDAPALMAAAGSLLGAIKSAADVHQHLREERSQASARIRSSPYALFWKLGLTQPQRMTRADALQLGPEPQQRSAAFDESVDSHWMCPPTSGMTVAMLEDEKASSKSVDHDGSRGADAV